MKIQYTSDLQIPMTPNPKVTHLHNAAASMLLLDYVLLVVIPVFFLIHSRVGRIPEYYNFTTSKHPIQISWEKDLYRALALFWPMAFITAWYAIRQVSRDPDIDAFREQLPTIFLGFCNSYVTYRIADLNVVPRVDVLLVDDSVPESTDEEDAAKAGEWSIGVQQFV